MGQGRLPVIVPKCQQAATLGQSRRRRWWLKSLPHYHHASQRESYQLAKYCAYFAVLMQMVALGVILNGFMDGQQMKFFGSPALYRRVCVKIA